MRGIWTPPGSRATRVTSIPVGDVRLVDGRLLKLSQGNPLADNPDFLEGGMWTGPQGLKVIASLDDTPHGRLLHVSLSYPNRDPEWATIRAVRDAYFPDTVDTMMVLPRAEDYVNVATHAFHVWQTPTTWGLR